VKNVKVLSGSWCKEPNTRERLRKSQVGRRYRTGGDLHVTYFASDIYTEWNCNCREREKSVVVACDGIQRVK
jgi:hypothetical protein